MTLKDRILEVGKAKVCNEIYIVSLQNIDESYKGLYTYRHPWISSTDQYCDIGTQSFYHGPNHTEWVECNKVVIEDILESWLLSRD